MNQLFTYEEFGLRSVMLEIAVVASMIAQFGTGRSLVKFSPIFIRGKSSSDNGLFAFSLMVATIGYLIFALLLLALQTNVIDFFFDKSSLIEEYYWTVFPLTFFMLFSTMFENKLQSKSNTALASFVKEVLNRLIVTGLLCLFYFKIISYFQFILFFILTYGLDLAIYFFHLKKNDQISWKINWRFFNSKLRKIYFKYSFFSIFTNMSGILLTKLDVIMLLFLMGLTASGIYANAMYLSVLIVIPSVAIVKISFPVLAEKYRNKDMAAILELYQKSSINQFLIGGVLFVLLWTSIDSVFLFQKEAYATGKNVILILCLSRLVDMLTGVNSQIISVSKHYPFEGITSTLLALIAVVTNFIFIPIYGLEGAAFATAISLVLFNVSRFIFIYLKMGLQPFDIKTVKAIAIVASGFLVGYFLPDFGNKYINIGYKSTVLITFFSILIIQMKISEDISSLYSKYIFKRSLK